MSDAAAISQFTQGNLATEVSIRVAVKAKDVAQQQGEAVISLLEGAAELSQTLATEPGKGIQLDVVA